MYVLFRIACIQVHSRPCWQAIETKRLVSSSCDHPIHEYLQQHHHRHRRRHLHHHLPRHRHHHHKSHPIYKVNDHLYNII